MNESSIYLFIARGGPMMWPLLIAATLALAVVLERAWFWFSLQRHRESKRIEDALHLIAESRADEAAHMLQNTRDFVGRVLVHGLAHLRRSPAVAMQAAASRELQKMSQFLPVLDTVITLAPLLGLLGTVFGIMGSFERMQGVATEPSHMLGGIAEALIVTGCGLGVAITALVPLNFFNARLQRAQYLIEVHATELETLLAYPAPPAESSKACDKACKTRRTVPVPMRHEDILAAAAVRPNAP